MRLGSANIFDRTLQNLYKRQEDLSSQQDKLSSGRNVSRASDDPTGMAQIERAQTRIARVATEQRALQVQRNAITQAESTLGDAGSLMQNIRESVIGAGNGAYDTGDRAALAQQMTGWREQLFALANRTDTNGIPLFGGLGSASAPFTDATTGVTFNGIAGQRASTDISVPGTMNGQAIWMSLPSGNGTFEVGLGGANVGSMWTDSGQVTSAAALTGHNYSVTFSVIAGVTTYDVLDTTTATPVAPAARPYVPGQAIGFDGLSFAANGTPANGDAIQIAPSIQTNIFKVIDDAINGIKTATSGNLVNQTNSLALSQIDAGMSRLQSARSQAGDWLNRVDHIDSAQQGRTVQLIADKSKVEEIDMVKGISDFTRFQTGYQAALQSYAQVQKLTLFNFIN